MAVVVHDDHLRLRERGLMISPILAMLCRMAAFRCSR
jgi:hypothetical protein